MFDHLYLANPIDSPLFVELAVKLALVFGVSIVLMILVSIRNLRQLFQTTMWQKFYTWMIMAPIVLVMAFSGGLLLAILVSFILFQGVREYLRMANPPRFFKFLTWIMCVLYFSVIVIDPQLWIYLPIICVIILIVATVIRNRVEESWALSGQSLFAISWLGLPCVTILIMGTDGGVQGNGAQWITAIVASVAISDVCAFFFGKLARITQLGNKPLAYSLSPNKVKLGIGGNIIGAIGGLLIFAYPNLLNEWGICIVGLIIGMACVVGDLFESLIKRTYGVKDTGTLIPHHGGLLDRVDSLLLAPLIIYCISLLLGEFEILNYSGFFYGSS